MRSTGDFSSIRVRELLPVPNTRIRMDAADVFISQFVMDLRFLLGQRKQSVQRAEEFYSDSGSLI